MKIYDVQLQRVKRRKKNESIDKLQLKWHDGDYNLDILDTKIYTHCLASIRSSPLPFNNSIAFDALFIFCYLSYFYAQNELSHLRDSQIIHDMVAHTQSELGIALCTVGIMKMVKKKCRKITFE